MGSPAAYLAFQRLQQLETQYDVTILYMPMLLGGVFKATGNSSPITIPAKGAYMMTHDLPRFASRYQVDMNANPHFPINTLTLMRGAIAARELDCEPAYLRAVYEAIWIEAKNMNDIDVVKNVLDTHNLDTEKILSTAQESQVKSALISATEAAVARGIFGAPTFFLENEMYFGQDRLDFIEAELAKPA